ncbi:ABC transporter transmembrane domain-containing protein [Lysobacter brunescens]|uniref:ABC transporter transmembrane domain-containing protein n=1 Tax=Lysobacter brunescens TaxID=262323 RepID=A0ABW2YC87_9GAMM
MTHDDNREAREAAPAGKGSLRALWPLIGAHPWLFAIWLMSLAVATGATLLLPTAMASLIDGGFAKGDAAQIDRDFLGMLGITLLLAVAGIARYIFASLLGERVVATLRERLYLRLLTLDAAFHDGNRSGELMSRLTSDVEFLRYLLTFAISGLLLGATTVVGAIAMLFVTNPRLASFALVAIPLAVLPSVLGGRRLRGLARAGQDRIADANALANETLSAVRTVQAHVREAHEHGRFATALEAAMTAARRRIQAQATLNGAGAVMGGGAVLCLLWLGAHDVAAGRMSPGTLAQFVMYALLGGNAATSLADVMNDLQRATGGMSRITELLARQPEVRAPAQPVSLPRPLLGEIEFEGVGFHYPQRPDTPALSDFRLRVRPGETVALVGPSGAGKSTVFSLLLRFHDPDRGTIRLDGVPLARLDPAELRTAVALVPQQSTLFSVSARENIRYGNLDADDAALDDAVRAAQAHDFIAALPQGLDTDLGERGTRLSGGQQQRIAIARALLKDAPILLLDEATSALDAHSEHAVQQALESLMRGRTTLVIAHRLATVLKADRIVVMDRGRIVAEGTHQSLMAQGGLYEELARLQFIDGGETIASTGKRAEAIG